MIKQYKTEMKNLVRRHGAEAMFKLFPTEADYLSTANSVLELLCDGDINYFYPVMDRFVKDSLVRFNLIELTDEI